MESELVLSVMVSGRCPCETADHHQCDREQVMSDFDLVVRGRLVDARRVVDDDWLAIRDGCFVASQLVGEIDRLRFHQDPYKRNTESQFRLEVRVWSCTIVS
jgi:hypothetical protein